MKQIVTLTSWQRQNARLPHKDPAIYTGIGAHASEQYGARYQRQVEALPQLIAIVERLISMDNCGYDLGVLNHKLSSDTLIGEARRLLNLADPDSPVSTERAR